jgi:hypothetical protein
VIPDLAVDPFDERRFLTGHQAGLVAEREQVLAGRRQGQQLHAAAVVGDVATPLPVERYSPSGEARS